MTRLQVAQELYAHAVGYYFAGEIKKSGIAASVKNYLTKKCEVIDIVDGGDTAIRKAAYVTVWNTVKVN